MRDRGWRVDSESHSLSQRFDFPQQVRDAVAEFDVDIHLGRASFGEWFQQNLRLGAHQMHIEKQFGKWPDRGHYRRPERDILDEMPVHNIKMKPIRA